MSTIIEEPTDGVGYAELDTSAVSGTQLKRLETGAESPETIVMRVTDAFLAELGRSERATPVQIRDTLLTKTNIELRIENTGREKNDQISYLKSLWPMQIAKVILDQHHVRNLKLTGGNATVSTIKLDNIPALLSVYVSEGPNKGVYVASEAYLNSLIFDLSPSISGSGLKDTMTIISNLAPTGEPSQSRNLVAVANGVFDTETKTLLPHSPEVVFTSKSRVNYVEDPVNPIIRMPDSVLWNIEEWVQELSDDPGVPELLWEGLSAVVRPNVSWNVGLFLYSELGNNGKGSYCALMRNLLGDSAWTGIAIADFGKDFMLEKLIAAQAVIQDENDVGEFIDKLANFKAAITGDVIQVNIKHKPAMAVIFRGLVVQCVNSFFKTKDKTDSFGRRQLFIPFEKHFKGIERKYIKDDYLNRQDVLEYVLWRVLQMDHTELSVPPACAALQKQYQEFNDPIQAFWAEFSAQLVWDLVPYSFLYDLYKSWMRAENPGGGVVSAMKFTQSVRGLTQGDARWDPGKDARAKHRPAGKMNLPEPLIGEYKLEDWMNPSYTGNMVAQRCRPLIQKDFYKGLVRK